MRQQDGKNRKKQAGSALAAIALFAFVVYLIHAAFGIAELAHHALLHFHEFFHQAISIATILAGALFAVVVYGVYWLHADALKECVSCVLHGSFFRHFGNNRSTYGRFFLSLSVVTLFVGVVSFVPDRPSPTATPQKTPPSDLATTSFEENPAVLAVVSAGNSPNEERLLPRLAEVFPKPRPQAARQNVCDLGNSFTQEQLDACQSDIEKHPDRKGTGGRIYILRKRADGWVIEPLPAPPLPPLRPPLKILPLD